MEQMARTNDLGECCEFMSKLLLAYVFETEKNLFTCHVDGRGSIAVGVDPKWRWVKPVIGHWEEHCFGESKGGDSTWLL